MGKENHISEEQHDEQLKNEEKSNLIHRVFLQWLCASQFDGQSELSFA